MFILTEKEHSIVKKLLYREDLLLQENSILNKFKANSG